MSRIVRSAGVFVGHLLQLLGHHVGGLALDPGEDQKQVLLKFRQPFRRERHAVHHDLVFRAELDQVETAKGGKDLVLAADVVLEDVPLDVNGLVGQFAAD